MDPTPETPVSDSWLGGDGQFTEKDSFLSSWQDTPIFGEVKRAWILTEGVSLKSCMWTKEAPSFVGGGEAGTTSHICSLGCTIGPSLLLGHLGLETSLPSLPSRDTGATEVEWGGEEGGKIPIHVPWRLEWPVHEDTIAWICRRLHSPHA